MREKYGIVHHDGPVMELTTMIGCPLMCTFCPQDNLRTNYGTDTKYMKQVDLTKMLVKLPKNTRIDFSGMSEPWANPECTSMLEEVLYMGFKVAIYTTLYGMKDPERVRKVLEDHPDQVEVIMLHLPDANGNMKGWKNNEDFKRPVFVEAEWDGRGEYPGAEKICRVPAAGGEVETLVPGQDPSWAPNSRTLMFCKRGAGGPLSLSLLDAPTKRVKDVPLNLGNCSQPAWAR